MLQVNVTELRNRLPYYLELVRKGVELQITSHGRRIARLVPEEDEVEAARRRLDHLRGTMIIGDVVNIPSEAWGADADNL